MNDRTIYTRAPVLALTAIAACATALPAHATEHKSSPQEAIGVTTGLTIGALAGGPFGAVFGAAAGGWLGDRFHRQKTQLAQITEEHSDLEAQIIFRTGESILPASAFEQVKRLGALASTIPNVRVRVSGYADARGTEESNSELSRRRAEAVAALLASEGVDASRIVVEAHGESAASAAEGDLDGYALERRVVIKIEQTATTTVARRN